MSGATGPSQLPYGIIAPTSPFVEVSTGRITREWYRFLLSLFATGGKGQPQPSPAQIKTALTELETLTASFPAPTPSGPDTDDLERRVRALELLFASSGVAP